MALFLWMGFNCLKAVEPLRGNSLLFTSKSKEGWKVELTLEQLSGVEPGTPGLGIQRRNL